MRVIDFHSHILPAMDDGSRNSDISMQMVYREHKDGVGCVIATPHFYAQKYNFAEYMERRKRSCDALREAIAAVPERDKLPRLLVGAEVYYFSGMGEAQMLSSLCIEGTRLLMVELPFAQWTASVVEDVKNLIEIQQMHVVIAHVERYYKFQKKKDCWNAMFDLPVTAQINGECFLGGFGERHFGWKYLKSEKPVVLGSDCHSMGHRKPNLGEARACIEKKLGSGALERIDRLGLEMLHDEETT